MSRASIRLQAESRVQKSERVAVRLTPDVKERLEYAAELTGRSVSDFVVASALEAAQAHIERQERFRLSDEDRAVFLAALGKPPAPNKVLRAAARTYRERTRG